MTLMDVTIEQAQVRALERIATALEQLALARMEPVGLPTGPTPSPARPGGVLPAPAGAPASLPTGKAKPAVPRPKQLRPPG